MRKQRCYVPLVSTAVCCACSVFSISSAVAIHDRFLWHNFLTCYKRLKEKINMTKQSSIWMLALMVALSFTSCEAIGSIFKAGMWAGIIIVIIVVALIIWIIRKVL